MRENGMYPKALKDDKPKNSRKSDGLYSEDHVKRQFSPKELNKKGIENNE